MQRDVIDRAHAFAVFYVIWLTINVLFLDVSDRASVERDLTSVWRTALVRNVDMGMCSVDVVAVGMRSVNVVAVGMHSVDFVAMGMRSVDVIAVGMRSVDVLVVGMRSVYIAVPSPASSIRLARDVTHWV